MFGTNRNDIFLYIFTPVIPGYGTLNQGESDRTADLVSVLAFDVSENTSVSVKIAHSIQLIVIAITTCMNKENVVKLNTESNYTYDIIRSPNCQRHTNIN